MIEAEAITAGLPNTTETTGGTIGVGSGMTAEDIQTGDPGVKQDRGERGGVGALNLLVI